jgi:alpha-galactosidase
VLAPNERGRFWLSDFGWAASSTSWGPIEIDRSNGSEAPEDGASISIGGHAYDKGIGVHAPAMILVALASKCQRFATDVGVDDGSGSSGSAKFFVFADDQLIWDGPKRFGEPPSHIEVDLTGKRWLRLEVNDGGDGPENDWADWADAELACERVD